MMTEQESRRDDVVVLLALLAEHHQDFSSGPFVIGCGCGGSFPTDAAHQAHVAELIVAAGYERRRDHVAEQDELRKQVRG